jgi:serine/threonine-protein kinase
MTPQTLGRYQIIAELGQGAMGTVYHGIDPTIERPVALKTLNPGLPDDIIDEVKQRFLIEAKSAGRLNHPSIVTIYEFGEADGIAYIAMEYLEGKSLQQLMRGERMPFALIAEIVAQIADGLDYAHRFGVVHRDIKPANIMVSPHGMAKLTDFGIARLQSSTMTQAGAMLGSPKYMSPEQVLGQPIDGRADIFSLGIVLYEMLAGHTPFEPGEATVFSLMQRIVTQPQPRLTDTLPGVPPAFDLILSRALAKKPADRYQRASQFAQDLRNFKNLGAGKGGAAAVEAPVAAPQPASAARNPGAAGPAPASDYEKTLVVPGGASTGWAITPPGGAAASVPPGGAAKSVPTGGGAAPLAAPMPPRPAAPPPVNAWQAAAAYLAGPTTVPPAPSPPVPQPQGPVSRFAAATQTLVDPDQPVIGDLAEMANDIDDISRKFIEEEANAMAAIRKGAPRAKDWDEISSGIEKVPTADQAAAAGKETRKSGVFGLLRQQASQNLKGQAEARREAESAALLQLDTKLRAGYAYLLDFCRELNEANPVFAGTHNLLFYGPCPPLYISDAHATARTSSLDDHGKIKEVIDHLLVSYHLLSAETGRVSVNATELPKLKAILELHEMKFEHRETRNDFNQVLRAAFKFEFKFICAFTLKANYAAAIWCPPPAWTSNSSRN